MHLFNLDNKLSLSGQLRQNFKLIAFKFKHKFLMLFFFI